jgi:hypothetical protein
MVPRHVVGNRGQGATISLGDASWRMWNLDTGAELEQTGTFFPLAPGTASYRLAQDMDYASLSPILSHHETTTWTFTSHPSDAPVSKPYHCVVQQAPRENVCQIQPLILLEYQLGLDIDNRAPAGRAHQFTVIAGHHSRAVHRGQVTSMTVQASFDSGATWHDAEVTGRPRDTWDTGGYLPAAGPYQQFHIVVEIPPLHQTDGSVTLQVRAEDANGGTVHQTIRDAYHLK